MIWEWTSECQRVCHILVSGNFMSVDPLTLSSFVSLVQATCLWYAMRQKSCMRFCKTTESSLTSEVITIKNQRFWPISAQSLPTVAEGCGCWTCPLHTDYFHDGYNNGYGRSYLLSHTGLGAKQKQVLMLYKVMNTFPTCSGPLGNFPPTINFYRPMGVNIENFRKLLYSEIIVSIYTSSTICR